MSTLRFLLGLMVGALIGAAIVSLTTPQSGHDTRMAVKGWVNPILQEGQKAFDLRKTELETRMAALQQKKA